MFQFDSIYEVSSTVKDYIEKVEYKILRRNWQKSRLLKDHFDHHFHIHVYYNRIVRLTKFSHDIVTYTATIDSYRFVLVLIGDHYLPLQ